MGLFQRIRIVFLPDLSLQTGMPCVSQALWHTLPSRPSVGWDVTVACPPQKKWQAKTHALLKNQRKKTSGRKLLCHCHGLAGDPLNQRYSPQILPAANPKFWFASGSIANDTKMSDITTGINVGHNQPCQIIANPRNWTLSGGESRSSIWHVFADNIKISS